MDAFSTSLTTTVFSQRGMWRFGTSPRRAIPKGLPSSSTQHCLPRGSYLHAPLFSHSWHTDITYIPTWEGFVYLATVIDCHSKAVIGWAMDDHFKTPLISSALEMAAGRMKIEKNAIFHSDRGSNYTSDEFARTLSRYGMRQSIGRTGVCWDNAMAESFFGALKNEWLNRYVFTTRAKARREVVRYIEGFYNRRRLHSKLGYRTPAEVLSQYHTTRLAA